MATRIRLEDADSSSDEEALARQRSDSIENRKSTSSNVSKHGSEGGGSKASKPDSEGEGATSGRRLSLKSATLKSAWDESENLSARSKGSFGSYEGFAASVVKEVVPPRRETDDSDEYEDYVVRDRTNRHKNSRSGMTLESKQVPDTIGAAADTGTGRRTESDDEAIVPSESKDEGYGEIRYLRTSKVKSTPYVEEDPSPLGDQDNYMYSDDEEIEERDPRHSPEKLSFIYVAQESGERTEHVQCVIVRDRANFGGSLYPTYKLLLEDRNVLLLVAQKMGGNRMSNYHIFDMTRGRIGNKLSKKHGNYIGKLKSKDIRKTEYVMYMQTKSRAKYGEELAAVRFDRTRIVEQMKEGSQPRKMQVLLPQLDADGVPVPHVPDGRWNSLLDMLCSGETGNMFMLKSKDPVFENGNYRLNFHGRVTVASVKNFQLVSPDGPDYVVCQFGKVGEDRFHLDFKAPLNAVSAFAMALCQFNL